MHLESLDDAFLAEMQIAARRTPPVSGGATIASSKPRTQPVTPPPAFKPEPSTAQNLFTAKQAAPVVRNKNFALLLGSSTALAVIAIGIYFWWQLQPHTPRPAVSLPHEVPLTLTPTPSPVAVSPAPTFSAPIPLANNATATDDNSIIAKPKNALRAAGQASQKSRRGTDDAMTTAEATDANDPVHLTKAPQQVNPSLLRGFDAFNRGDLASAHAEYTRALQSDPRNTDALHGLAAIAQKRGHWDQAAWGYQKILEANPQDAVALAALINIRSQTNPVMAESRLKTLTVAQPELAAPAFSLGNLYARQGRWSEAQQAYFQAYSAEPNNPDILYNLAISLEHMRQSKLAVQYYGQAIAAAKTHPANFDNTQAAARMQALQP
jgi:tetratricopeptide (TPR) repeat protein